MAAKQVTFHFQRTPDAGLPAERAIWGDAEAEQVLLLHERGHVLHRSVRRPASGNSFRLVMYEYGPEAEHGQLVASGALYIERAFAAVAFVPGSSSRIFFALEHSAQLLSADLPIAEPAVAQVPVIPVAVAVHQSSICSIACSGEFVALGYEDGSVGFWQLPAPLHAQQRRLGVPGPALAMPPLSGPASMSLKRHAHSGKVVSLSALQRSSPTFALALLASAGDEGTVWLWDLLSATRLASFGPLPAEASAPSALGTALLARPGGAHGEVALCIGRPRGQLRLHLLAEEGQPRQPEQWEKVGLGDVRAGLGDARGAAGGGLEDAAEGNHVGFRAEEKVISPPVADVHSAPLRLVHVALSDDGRFAAALYSPRAASAAGSGRSASADGDGEVLRVFGLAEAGLVRTWQVSDGDGDELHGERVLSVCWGTPKVHGGSLPLHACLSSGRLLHWEVGSRNGHLLLEQLRTSGRQSSSLPALALSPSRRGGASGRSSHLADIPLTGAERGRAQRSRVGSAPGSPARQASGQPSHASARHGVASVSGVDWLGSEGSHSHRYAGARHAGGGPYGEVSSLPLTAHGSEASSPALARARAAAGRRSGTDFGGGYGAGHGGGYASEGEAEDGEGSEMRSRDGGAHPAAHSRSFLRSESMLSGWADATPADRNADRSADHAADGEPAAAQPRPQQARTGARPTSQPPANFGDFPLAGVSAANALASAHLHSSAALESELAALYEQLQHDRDGQAGLLLHTQAVGGGGGEAAPADGMRKDASAHRRTSPARTRSPRGLALKSSQVLNMSKEASRFGAVPRLYEEEAGEPAAAASAGARARPAQHAARSAKLATPRGQPMSSSAAALALRNEPYYTADRELEVRSIEVLPPTPRMQPQPASLHALLGRSLHLLASEHPALELEERIHAASA